VRLVISDTGPINYLVLIGHIDLLPILFERVIMPVAVLDELADPDAPPSVRAWIANPPNWIEVRESPAFFDDALLATLDDGERAAIALAALHPELLLLLMDDRAGVLVARKKGLAVTGTLGVLDMASQRGLLDLAEAFKRLRNTTFRCPEEIMNGLLRMQKRRDP
jgi:predicted nucleic acid-binding protein